MSSKPSQNVLAIISLYRSNRHLGTLKRQLKNIEDQDDILFYFVFSDPTLSEREFAKEMQGMLKNSVCLILSSRVTLYKAWNLAITSTSTTYITNLNADDYRMSFSIRRMANFLNSHPQADIVYTDYISVGHEGIYRTVKTKEKFSLFDLVFRGKNPCHAAPMWRRSVHDSIGLFDENYESGGDTEFWLRAHTGGLVFNRAGGPSYYYFENPEGLSTKKGSLGRKEWVRSLSRHAFPIFYTLIKRSWNRKSD